MSENELKDKNIDPSLFEFSQLDTTIHDQKFDTKPVGYFRDALRRFAKNKGSVVAACIILVLLLFALITPMASQYELGDKDPFYSDKAPYVKAFKDAGFWDGGRVLEVPESMYKYYLGIYEETGYNPVLKVVDTKKDGPTTYYKIRLNTYHALGVLRSISLSREEYYNVLKFQDETGLQVIYPYVENSRINDLAKADGGGNYWYEVNSRGIAKLDADGNFKPVYAMQNGSTLYPEYDSLRIASDPYDEATGNVGYAYAKESQTGYDVRLCYWNYYIFKNGHEPAYAFGTNTLGQDMLTAIGIGARFSLLLALCVSAINIVLGIIYGSIEGYYGGVVDMTMERVSDILSGIPLMIVVSLFNMHLASTIGVVPVFILAFVATRWIGTASLVRKQFYRFKGQEYVLAARTLGASDKRIMFKHVFPNSLGTIVTSCVLDIPAVIGSETMLTYLGIVNLSGDNLTSIGALMELGNTAAKDGIYHVLLIPAIFFALLMLSFNLFGNGLRDAFNPSLRGSEG